MARFSELVEFKNRRASFKYEWLDKLTVGLVLRGSEIKSIRDGKVSLTEAYCYFHQTECFVKSLSIQPYKEGAHWNHEADRERKLLMKKSEIKKWRRQVEEKGLTVIPTRLFINAKGLAKMDIVLAKGKKLFDKRQSIKERDVQRRMREKEY